MTTQKCRRIDDEVFSRLYHLENHFFLLLLCLLRTNCHVLPEGSRLRIWDFLVFQTWTLPSAICNFSQENHLTFIFNQPEAVDDAPPSGPNSCASIALVSIPLNQLVTTWLLWSSCPRGSSLRISKPGTAVFDAKELEKETWMASEKSTVKGFGFARICMFCPHSLEWFTLNRKTLPRTSNAGGLQPKTHPTFTVQRLCSVLPGRRSFHFETGKSSAIEARGVYSLSKSRQLLDVVLIEVHPKSHDASEKKLFIFGRWGLMLS